MFSCRLRPWLVLSALLGLGSCELNPQPDLPGSRGVHDPAIPDVAGSPENPPASGGGMTQPTQPGSGQGAQSGSGNLGLGGTTQVPPERNDDGGADGSSSGASPGRGEGGDGQGGAQ